MTSLNSCYATFEMLERGTVKTRFSGWYLPGRDVLPFSIPICSIPDVHTSYLVEVDIHSQTDTDVLSFHPSNLFLADRKQFSVSVEALTVNI